LEQKCDDLQCESENKSDEEEALTSDILNVNNVIFIWRSQY